jgi:ABC-type dipeptide/oligopeptide/nickel transport system permease subunit
MPVANKEYNPLAKTTGHIPKRYVQFKKPMKNKYSILFIKVLLTISYLLLILEILKHLGVLVFDFNLFKVNLATVVLLSITLVSDALSNRVYNKWFWAWSLFIMPLISAPFYLFHRGKLIRLGSQF